MPIYDFLCPNCGLTFESLSKPNEPVKCKDCGGYPCKQLISAHGTYQIKGDNSASTRPKRG